MSLADTYNLRAEQASMSDVATFADTMEAILTWTPSYTFNGTSITLDLLNYAEYVKIGGGKLVHVQGSMRVVTVGSGAFLEVSLPINARAGTYKSISGFISNNSSPLNFEPVSGIVSGGTVTLQRTGATAYAAGTWNLYFSGTYYTV